MERGRKEGLLDLRIVVDKDASIRVLERRNARTLVTRTSPYTESAFFCASITILLYEVQYPERWLVFPSYRRAGQARKADGDRIEMKIATPASLPPSLYRYAAKISIRIFAAYSRVYIPGIISSPLHCRKYVAKLFDIITLIHTETISTMDHLYHLLLNFNREIVWNQREIYSSQLIPSLSAERIIVIRPIITAIVSANQCRN